MRILLVEDELHTQNLLKTSLIGENFLVDEAADGETAWELLQQFPYDLVLLDVMLPRLNGISLCQRLRQAENPIPVLLLTTRCSVLDKLSGLESGADDYVTKPFHMQELIARIRTVARRNPTTINSVLTCERLHLDPVSREVTYDGQPLKIGRKEYLILELLLRHPNQVFSRYDIIDRLWSLDEEVPTEATVKSHVRSIRRKLEQVNASELIETLYGQGYRLNPTFLAPPAPQPLSAANLHAVDTLTAQVWQRAYAKSLDKLSEIEQAIAALQSGSFEATLRQQTVFTVHKLAGSLYVFGFETAAQLLQHIEDELRQTVVSPETAAKLLQWLQVVRLELAGQQSSNTQIQTAPLPPTGSQL